MCNYSQVLADKSPCVATHCLLQELCASTVKQVYLSRNALWHKSGANHSLCLTGAKYTFTIKEGADGKNGRISVNYDGFIDDVGVNDMLLVDGGMLSLKILEKTKQDVVCEVVDGGVMGSRYTFY